jgi:dynein heavy chain, axonemal
MKGLGTPPAGVILCGRVILILFGERISLNDPDDKVWKKALGAMNNPIQFLEKVKGYNGENIDENILDPVTKILKDPAKKFNEKDMAGQNYAASKLAAWVVNIIEFNRIFKLVKPL